MVVYYLINPYHSVTFAGVHTLMFPESSIIYCFASRLVVSFIHAVILYVPYYCASCLVCIIHLVMLLIFPLETICSSAVSAEWVCRCCLQIFVYSISVQSVCMIYAGISGTILQLGPTISSSTHCVHLCLMAISSDVVYRTRYSSYSTLSHYTHLMCTQDERTVMTTRAFNTRHVH